MIAIPLASVTGGPISGLILDHARGFGLASWRWLLILEALPAIGCGLATYRLLPDNPQKAPFLSAAEKTLLSTHLASELPSAQFTAHRTDRWDFVRMPVLHLVAVHLLVMMGLYALSFWMPQSLKAVATGYSNAGIGMLVVIPSALSVVAQILVSRSSDRQSERHIHLAVTLGITAVGLYAVPHATGLLTCVMAWSAVAFGIGGYFGPFWACASRGLNGQSAALGLAVINSIGNVGSYIASAVIGEATHGDGSPAGGYTIIAVALAGAGVLIFAHRLHERVAQAGTGVGVNGGRSNVPTTEPST
jgi:ACS family tartrate transporter-like MFS transporter